MTIYTNKKQHGYLSIPWKRRKKQTPYKLDRGKNMITVKLLKPYYMKVDKKIVRVVLAYQYFALLINDQIYQFIPTEEREIQVNRKTKAIENIHATFAFQKGKDIIYKSMYELIMYPNFLFQLHSIVEPYFTNINIKQMTNHERVIHELEQLNIKRRIDQALDTNNKKLFYELVQYLSQVN